MILTPTGSSNVSVGKHQWCGFDSQLRCKLAVGFIHGLKICHQIIMDAGKLTVLMPLSSLAWNRCMFLYHVQSTSLFLSVRVLPARVSSAVSAWVSFTGFLTKPQFTCDGVSLRLCSCSCLVSRIPGTSSRFTATLTEIKQLLKMDQSEYDSES